MSMDSYSVETMICPSCHADLPADAERCVRCGSSTRPSNGSDELGRPGEQAERLRDRPWLLTILLLHLGVFGIPLYWQARYSRNIRIGIVIVSILYTILVIVVVAWGVMQIARAIQMI